MRHHLSAGLVALAFIPSGHGTAAEVLDQSFVPGSPANAVDAVVDDVLHQAQTFTIGVEGTLSKIGFFLTRNSADTDQFTYRILRTDPSGLPDETQVLRSGNLPGTVLPSSPPGSGSFNLGIASFNIAVNPGEILAIAVSRAVPADLIWRGETANPYPAGGAFRKDVNGSNQWEPIPDTDFGFRIFVEPPPEPANVVVYPTEAAVEIRDLAAGASHAVNYAGSGPGAPLARDVDLTISPNGARAVYPSPDGIEIVDLQAKTARRSTWLSSGAVVPIVPGIDCAILPDSSFAIYPTPTHFELASLTSGNKKSSGYRSPVPSSLTRDIDLALTPSGSHAVLPFDQGFQVYDTATNITRFVAFGGGAVSSMPIAVDVLFTPGGKGIYPASKGWEILDPVTRTSTHVAYAGAGPLLPLPVDVDPFYSAAFDKAVYPSQDGLEVLNVAAGTTQLLAWAGPGAPLPLTRSVDAPLSPDGQKCIFPTIAGFEVFDLAAGTATLAPYAGSGPHFERLRGLQEGVDVLIASDSATAVYPTPAGLEVLDLAALTSSFVAWGGGALPTPMARGVDAVLSSDGAVAVFVRLSGFEVVPLPGGPATLVPFAGAGPGASMPLDVDPIFHDDDQQVFYPTPGGYERLDLSGPPSASTISFAGTAPGAPLPTGIDPIVQPHHSGGPPTLNMAFSNDDPGDEDYVLDDNDPDPPGTEVEILSVNLVFGWGHEGFADFPAEIRTKLANLEAGKDTIEVPPGRLEAGELPNSSLEDTGWTLVRDGAGGPDVSVCHPTRGTTFTRSRWGDYSSVSVDPNATDFYLDFHGHSVPEAVWNDRRALGVEQSSDSPHWIDDIMIGFAERGELVVGPVGRNGPGGLTGDFSGTGLVIGGPNNRSVTGVWGSDENSSYLFTALDTTTGDPMGLVYYRPWQTERQDLALYDLASGGLILPNVNINLFSRRNGTDVTVRSYDVLNVSTPNAGTLDWMFTSTGNSSEITLSGTTSGQFTTPGQSAVWQFERAVNPANDPETYTVSASWNAGSQTRSNPVTWTEIGPRIWITFSNGLWLDPTSTFTEPRAVTDATEIGENVTGTIFIHSMPADGPAELIDTEVTSGMLQGTFGGSISLDTTTLPATLKEGETIALNVAGQVNDNEFGWETVLNTLPEGDIPTIPIAGNTPRPVLEMSGNGITSSTPTAFEWDFGSTFTFSVNTSTATFTNTSLDPNVDILIANGLEPVGDDSGLRVSFDTWSSHEGPAVKAGDTITTITPETAQINFRRTSLGPATGTSSVRYFTTNGSLVGSMEKPLEINFVGRAVADNTSSFTDIAFGDPGEVSLKFPVVQGVHYVVGWSVDADLYTRLQFEAPPAGSGLFQDFITAPTTKPNFEVIAPRGTGTSGSRGFYEVEGHDGLRVTGTVVNDGQRQRSRLCTICVFFNLASNLDELSANGTIDNAVKVEASSTGDLVPLKETDFSYDPTRRKLTISFEEATDAEGKQLQLDDGYYNVVLDTALIHLANDPASPLLDDDTVADTFRVIDGEETSIFALRGDTDGDGYVGAADLQTLSIHLQEQISDGELQKALDLNDNHLIDSADLNVIGINWQQIVPR